MQKVFPRGARGGREGKGKAATHWCAFSWLWHWHTHTEAVYYDYYLCGLNPQLLKRSLKFNIHLHFGQKTFQALMREREKGDRERRVRERRETDSFTSGNYNLRPISAASETWRPQRKTDEVESPTTPQPPPPFPPPLHSETKASVSPTQISVKASWAKRIAHVKIVAETKISFSTEQKVSILQNFCSLLWHAKNNFYLASFIINLSNSFE